MVDGFKATLPGVFQLSILPKAHMRTKEIHLQHDGSVVLTFRLLKRF